MHFYSKIKLQVIISSLSFLLLPCFPLCFCYPNSCFSSFYPLHLINLHIEKLSFFFNLKLFIQQYSTIFLVLGLFYTKLAEALFHTYSWVILFFKTYCHKGQIFTLVIPLYTWIPHNCYLIVIRKEQVEILWLPKEKGKHTWTWESSCNSYLALERLNSNLGYNKVQRSCLISSCSSLFIPKWGKIEFLLIFFKNKLYEQMHQKYFGLLRRINNKNTHDNNGVIIKYWGILSWNQV